MDDQQNISTSSIQDEIRNLNDGISEMKSRLETLEKLLLVLVKDVENVRVSTENMDSHIDFVNGVYTKIHQPFHSLMNVASRFISEEVETPSLDQTSTLAIQNEEL